MLFPATTPQTCIVHLLRHRLDFVNWKERKALAAALRPIDTAVKLTWLARRNIRASWGKAADYGLLVSED